MTLSLLQQTFYCLISQMLYKFAEDDRIEQMNAQKRRMKQLEHKRAVERLIDERREQMQKDKVDSQYFPDVGRLNINDFS